MFMIASVSPKHNGNYTCLAENRARSVNQTAEFHVDGKMIHFYIDVQSISSLNRSASSHCCTVGLKLQFYETFLETFNRNRHSWGLLGPRRDASVISFKSVHIKMPVF